MNQVIKALEDLLALLKAYAPSNEMIFLCTSVDNFSRAYLIKPTIDNEFAKHVQNEYFKGGAAWWQYVGNDTDNLPREELIKQRKEIILAKIAYVEDLITYYKTNNNE